MSLRRLRLALGTSVALVAAIPASAQPVPAAPPPAAGRGEPLTMASVSVGLGRFLLGYLRLVADVRYGSLEVDPSGQGIVLRDLRIAGLGDAGRCQISLGRMRASGVGAFLGRVNDSALDLADLRIANNCFQQNAAMIGALIGSDAVTISRFSMVSRDVPGTGAARINVSATMPDFARIEAAGDFDHVSFSYPTLLQAMAEASGPSESDLGTFDPETGEYVAPPDMDDGAAPDAPSDEDAAALDVPPEATIHGILRSAHVSVQDRGGWQKVAPLVFGSTNVAPEQIEGIVTAEPGTPTHAFQEKLEAALKVFVADPGWLTIALRPPAPVTFDSSEWTGPDDALTLLTPEITNAPPLPAVALIASPEVVGDARAQGLALARGTGLPVNPRGAIALLSPLADDPEVALALADLTAASDPAGAYGYALRAAQSGTPEALAALDRAERALPVAAILAAQAPADAPVPETAFASVEALRQAALGYEYGEGAARSYGLAWRLASLAAATGDGVAQQVLDRLDSRFAGDPAWIAVRDAAVDQAARDWTGQSLASRLAVAGP